MKLLATLISAASLMCGASLQNVRTVYLMPMHSGLDQYLAGRLAQERLFAVVTDPKAADAVFTDRLGASFEQEFEQRVLGQKPGANDAAIHPAFSSGRGTLFLVSRDKRIVWSTYAPSKDTSPGQLEKTARKAVERLRKDFLPPKLTPAS